MHLNMEMKNLKSFEEFINSYIRMYNIPPSLNESVAKDFYEGVFKTVSKITNEKILVVNSPLFAELLCDESNKNKVVCIYFDESADINPESSVEYRFVNFGVNDNEILADTQKALMKVQSEFGEFDKIFNFSLPMKDGLRYDHIAKFNYLIFKKWFIPGVTTWMSFDESDVQDQFSKIVYSKEKYKISPTQKITSEDWENSGFEGGEDRYITHIFVRESGTMGGISAEEMDNQDTVNKYTDIADGILKHYIEPRIYAFRTDLVDNVISPSTALKVGDTDRGVDKRMDEWREKFPDLEHIKDWSAVVSGCGDGLDGKVFRDHTIHKILESWGKKRLEKDDFGEENKTNGRYSSEFFYDVTPDDVEKAIEHLHKLIKDSRYDIIAKLKTGKKRKSKYILPTHDKKIKFKERDLQTMTIDKFAERFVTGDKEMLMYAVMRFGKTYTACRCAQEFGGKFTVVVSAKADVKGEWLAAVNPYKDFENYDMYLASGEGSLYNMLNENGYSTLDEYLKDHPEKHVMLFITLQDLNMYISGRKSEAGMRNYDCFIDQNVDLLIIDEAHYGPQGQTYGKGIGEGWDREEKDETVDKEEFSVEDTKRLIESLNLENTVKLHLSGTPYDLVARGKFDMESIIAKFGFEELMEAKQAWIDQNAEKIKTGEVKLDQNPYYGIPNMIQFGYKFSDFDLQKVMDEGSISFLNLFTVVGKKGSYKFKYENEILGILKAIDGSERKEGVMAILDSPKLKKEKMCKHLVMVLPRRKTCDVMAQLLEDHKDELKNLGEYKVVKIASEIASEGLDTEDAKDIIRSEDEAGNKTISLTVIQMLTGVSVKEWDTMLYMKDGIAPQPYDQARFRIQTPNIGEREVLDLEDMEHVKPVKDENGKIVTLKIDRKPQTLFVDFSVDRCYKVLYDKFHTECKLEGVDEEDMFEKMKEKLVRYLKHMPILYNNFDSIQEVEIENVMVQIFKAYAESTLKGNTLDEQLGGIDWKGNLDIENVDYSFMSHFADSYVPGKGGYGSIGGHMTKGEEKEINTGDPELDAELEKDLEEFEKELEDDGVEIPEEDVKTDDSSSTDTGDSDSDVEIDTEKEEELAKKWTADMVNDKCNALMKNIMIYMLCRNDDIKVFKNIHDLVWDSMRSPANYDVILNIFDQEHAKETDSKRKEYYVNLVRRDINLWSKIILKKNPAALKQVLAMIVGACLSRDARHDFDTIKDKLSEFGKGAIGSTEFITPDDVIEKLATSGDFVIFNKDSKILDCYGSKTGEILHYIVEKVPDYNIDNYFVICKNGWTAELNKAVIKTLLAKQGRKFSTMEKLSQYLDGHVLIADPERDYTGPVKEGYVYEGELLERKKSYKTELKEIKLVRAIHLEYAIKNKKWHIDDTRYKNWSDMKFDVEIGNPPYDGNLHLKIINSVLPYLKEDGTASFIHPARWLQDPLAEYKQGTDKVRFANIVDRLDDVKVIDNKTAILKFNILISSDLMISKIKARETGKKNSLITEIAQKCIDVIVSYSKNYNIAQYDEKNKSDGWRCQIDKAILLGDKNHRTSDKEADRKGRCHFFGFRKNNVFEDGFDENGIYWTETRARNQFSKKVGTPFPHSIKFNSKEEALNFQVSCITNFFSNIIYLLKYDQATPLDFLPWMQDYSHPWTDEDYCEFFGKLGMSETCQKWMCRDVYDYRVKDFINYETFDEEDED